MVQFLIGTKRLLSWLRNFLLFDTSNVKYSFYGSLTVVPSPSLVKPNSVSHLLVRSKIILLHCRYCVLQELYGLKTLNWLITTSLSASCPIHRILYQFMVTTFSEGYTLRCSTLHSYINPYPTAFPYGNGMVLHFYQQQESSTTKTVHKVINKGLKTYV